MNDDAREHPDDAHTRPGGVSDATVDALGKLSAAREVVETARGHLYAFHRQSGEADFALGEAVDALRAAGHVSLADSLEHDLVGRNVIEGRWTFQLVEEYDDTYYSAFTQAEARARDELVGGRRHLFEAELKEERRTHGARHHESRPAGGA